MLPAVLKRAACLKRAHHAGSTYSAVYRILQRVGSKHGMLEAALCWHLVTNQTAGLCLGYTSLKSHFFHFLYNGRS